MFDIRESTDKITHSTSGNKLGVRESEDMRHLCRKGIFITTCLALFFVITGPQKNFMLYRWLKTQFPDSNGMRTACEPQYLLKPIHAANIDLCDVEKSHNNRRIPEAMCSIISFLLPYVWLNKLTVLPLFTLCSQVNEAKQVKICSLQTKTYIIYFFDWCSSLVGGLRPPSPQTGRRRSCSLSDLLQDRLLLVHCGETAAWSQEACLLLRALISTRKRELCSHILPWRAIQGASAQVQLTRKHTQL